MRLWQLPILIVLGALIFYLGYNMGFDIGTIRMRIICENEMMIERLDK